MEEVDLTKRKKGDDAALYNERLNAATTNANLYLSNNNNPFLISPYTPFGNIAKNSDVTALSSLVSTINGELATVFNFDTLTLYITNIAPAHSDATQTLNIYGSTINITGGVLNAPISSFFNFISTTVLQASSFSVGSIITDLISATTVKYDVLVGSTITTSTITVNSTLNASTINTTTLNYSTLIGSTISTNTLAVNSTLNASTINTNSLNFSSFKGSSIVTDYLTVNSTLSVSTVSSVNIYSQSISTNYLKINSTITVSTMNVSTIYGSTISSTRVSTQYIDTSTLNLPVIDGLITTAYVDAAIGLSTVVVSSATVITSSIRSRNIITSSIYAATSVSTNAAILSTIFINSGFSTSNSFYSPATPGTAAGSLSIDIAGVTYYIPLLQFP